MISSDTAVWKPSTGETSKKIGGPNEVTALSLKSGGAAATVSIYDAADQAGATESNLKWVLDAAAPGNDNQSFNSPLIFKKGIFAVCDQGNNFNPILCVSTNRYAAA